MALTQYNATGKVIDLTGMITNISPSDTPIYSYIGRADKAKQVKHSWEEDELPQPTDNAQVEGADYETEDPGETSILDNVTQIFRRGYGVTDTNMAVKRYNISNKLAYEMQKAMKAISMDVERAIVSNTKKVLGNKATARKMAGLPYFLKTNLFKNDGAPRPMTYKLLNDVLEQVYTLGGNPDAIFVSARNKRILSGLLPESTTRDQKAEAKKLVATIDVFEGDFGIQRVITDRWLPNSDIYILSGEYMGVSYLRPFTRKELPKDKDATEQVIIGELTLEVRAEKASARITDLDGLLPEGE
ncbi:MAG: DUF5309 domain-containing protein [Pyramidobacter sp.]|nr:DUF5309 domain-containing protein [Pyramidobacter sp.]